MSTRTIRIKKGLDLPITGAPPQEAPSETPRIRTLALLGDDYIGLKAAPAVKVGEGVKTGQLLFSDRKIDGLRFTSPGTGKVIAIHRGKKRRFQSIVIELDGHETLRFPSYSSGRLGALGRAEVVGNLVESGLWTAIRARPFSRIPAPADPPPHALFVTAIDTHPLSVRPEIVLNTAGDDFRNGLIVLKRLVGERPLYLCRREGAMITGTDLDGITDVAFSGPHPAGLVGTHIHFLAPVDHSRVVWHINYQDVISVGKLFTTGLPDFSRVISIGGPAVRTPAIVKTRVGASLPELLEGRIEQGPGQAPPRPISGSVLSGRRAEGPHAFLGRYHLQVSVLREGAERRFLGWQRPGFDTFSVTRAFGAALLGRRLFPMTTSREGSRRAMVPIGTYERVMPLDILPTPLLRALIVGDTEQAQALGCLELDEEDLSLCTFVCPGKYEYGPILRENLTRIEREG